MTTTLTNSAIEAGEIAEQNAGYALLAIVETLDNDLQSGTLDKNSLRRLTNIRNTLKNLMNGNSVMRPIIHEYAKERYADQWLRYLQQGVTPDRQPVASDGRNIFKPQKK